jgi:dihydrofolate reductase
VAAERPRLSVFIAASLDGYIATTDGNLGWLEASAREGEDYGYDTFLTDVDALAMGRGTYDHIASIDPLPFGERPVYVFTHRAPPPRDGVTFWELDAAAAVRRWTELEHRHVYVDGGVLISSFLQEGLIDDLTITIAPVLLGDGIRLFPGGFPQTLLALDDAKPFPGGMVTLRYRVPG